MLILTSGSAFAHADLCFRSAPAAIEGVPGRATLSVLWADSGRAMDEIKIDGERISVATEMICRSAAPIVCRLGDGVGVLRLVFDGDRLRVVSGGLKVVAPAPAGRLPSRLLVKTGGALTMVNELIQLSEDECKTVFPDRRTISVFPEISPEKLETKAPQTSR